MRRTTVMFDDDVLKRLKEMAAKEGVTLGGLVNRLLRQAMTPGRHPKSYKLDLRGWDAQIQPGVDILDRDKLFDLMNGR